MPIYAFDLPNAAAVRENSRLRPEQVNIEYSNAAALVAETQERIDKKAVWVNSKITRLSSPLRWPFADAVLTARFPGYATDQIAAETTQQKALATEAVELFALASLYRSAGQMNPRYRETANEYEARANEIMNELKEIIGFVTDGQSGLGVDNGVSVWTVSTGLSITGDEYAR